MRFSPEKRKCMLSFLSGKGDNLKHIKTAQDSWTLELLKLSEEPANFLGLSKNPSPEGEDKGQR